MFETALGQNAPSENEFRSAAEVRERDVVDLDETLIRFVVRLELAGQVRNRLEDENPAGRPDDLRKPPGVDTFVAADVEDDVARLQKPRVVLLEDAFVVEEIPKRSRTPTRKSTCSKMFMTIQRHPQRPLLPSDNLNAAALSSSIVVSRRSLC